MKAQYDTMDIVLSEEYMISLESTAKAFMEMMREQDKDHEDCWDWCQIEVRDLASSSPSFCYGGNEDRPEGFPEGEVLLRVVQ